MLRWAIRSAITPGCPSSAGTIALCAWTCAGMVTLMASLEWSDQLHRIKCPTLVVYPGAETVGSTHNYDAMRQRIPDVEVISYESLPHNICDSVPDRCAEDVLRFLGKRFP